MYMYMYNFSCRPCAMVVPDFELIAEIMLVAEGFINARILARKFLTLYTLCKELLSKQDHYDWGLRAIKSVLVVAGSLKRSDRGRPEDQVHTCTLYKCVHSCTCTTIQSQYTVGVHVHVYHVYAHVHVFIIHLLYLLLYLSYCSLINVATIQFKTRSLYLNYMYITYCRS